MSGSGLDKARLRTLDQARADHAKARPRPCMDCPGVQSLLCCGRVKQISTTEKSDAR